MNHLSLAILLLLTLTPRETAASPTPEPETSVELRIRPNGDFKIKFSSDTEPPTAEALKDVLARMFDCEPRIDSRDQGENAWYLSATAPSAFQRETLTLGGSFSPGPLIRLLLEDDEDRIRTGEVTLRLPLAPILECEIDNVPSEAANPDQPNRIELVLDAGLIPSSISFRVGYNKPQLIALGLPLASLLAFVLLATLIYRGTILRRPIQDIARLNFRFHRIRRALTKITWFAWLAIALQLGLDRFFIWMATSQSLAPGGLLLVAIAIAVLPPLAIVTLCQTLLGDVSNRVLGSRQTRLGAALQTLTVHAVILIPTLSAAGATYAFGVGRTKETILLAMTGLIGFAVFIRLIAKTFGIRYYPLTEGQLRDRISTIADENKVRVQRVLIGSTGHFRQTNAAVVRQGMLFLTDTLVAQLTKNEVDAILAHEMSHLQNRDVRKLKLAFLVGTLGPFFLAMYGFGLNLVTPSGILFVGACFQFGSLIRAAMSRRIERKADREAASHCGDPEGLLSGIVKLTRSNRVPLEWGPLEKFWLTHPSTMERARSLADTAGIDSERLQVLLEGKETGDHYELPSVASNEQTVLSFAFKQRVSALYNWVFRSTDVLAPAATAWIVETLGATGPSRTALYTAGWLSTVALAVAAKRAWVYWLHSTLHRRLKTRKARDGENITIENGILAGFGPDSTPRFYEGFFEWDFGFVIPDGDFLVFSGDKCRWRLHRSDVLDVTVVSGLPGWTESNALRVEWKPERDEDRSRRFLLYSTLSKRPFGVHQRFAELADSVRDWKKAKGGTVEPSDPSRILPPREEIVSYSPRWIGHRSNVVRGVMEGVIGAIAVGIVLGLPFSGGMLPSGVYVVIAAAAINIIDFIPYWRYREPSSDRSADEPTLAEARIET